MFVDHAEVGHSPSLSAAGSARILTVVVPSAARARGVVAQIGSTTLVLRRIHARHNGLECCRGPDVACFAGLVLDEPLEQGSHAVRFSIFD